MRKNVLRIIVVLISLSGMPLAQAAEQPDFIDQAEQLLGKAQVSYRNHQNTANAFFIGCAIGALGTLAYNWYTTGGIHGQFRGRVLHRGRHDKKGLTDSPGKNVTALTSPGSLGGYTDAERTTISHVVDQAKKAQKDKDGSYSPKTLALRALDDERNHLQSRLQKAREVSLGVLYRSNHLSAAARARRADDRVRTLSPLHVHDRTQNSAARPSIATSPVAVAVMPTGGRTLRTISTSAGEVTIPSPLLRQYGYQT